MLWICQMKRLQILVESSKVSPISQTSIYGRWMMMMISHLMISWFQEVFIMVTIIVKRFFIIRRLVSKVLQVMTIFNQLKSPRLVTKVKTKILTPFAGIKHHIFIFSNIWISKPTKLILFKKVKNWKMKPK